MDPLVILQNRIEQLEAKLGLAENITPSNGQEGDSATTNLLNTAQAINSAIAGHEKLNVAKEMASELNNYTDPNFVEKLQENDMHKREVVAAEPVIRHHCQCMHRCKQAAPVLESEPIQQAAQMQDTVNTMHAAAAAIREESDAVSQGIQELAATCGNAASNASEQLAEIAQKVENVEQKMFPRRRNGLD